MFAKVLRKPIDIKSRLAEDCHILMIRSDHVGDMVLTIPFVRALRSAFPKAETAFAASALTAPLLKECPYLDKLLVIDYGNAETMAACEAELRSWRVDLAIVPAMKSRDYRLAARSGARYRIGRVSLTSRIAGAFINLTHLEFDEVRLSRYKGLRQLHEIERQQHTAALLGIPYTDTRLELFFSAEDLEFCRQLAERFGKPWLVMHLHQNLLHGLNDLPETVWDEAGLFHLIERIAEFAGERKVIFTYGPTEAEMVERAEAVIKRLNRRVAKLNGRDPWPDVRGCQLLLLGGLSLGQWAQVLGSGSCTVSVDTGAVHMAAAQGCPVIDIFPPYGISAAQGCCPWQVPYAIVNKRTPAETADDIIRELGFYAAH